MSQEPVTQSAFEFGPAQPDVITPGEITGNDDLFQSNLECDTDRTEVMAQLAVMHFLESRGFRTCIARTSQAYDLLSDIPALELPDLGITGHIAIQVKGTEKVWTRDITRYQFNTKRHTNKGTYSRYLTTDLHIFAFAPTPESSIVFRLPCDLVVPRIGGIPYSNQTLVATFQKPDITELTLKYCLGRIKEQRDAIRRAAERAA